MRTICFVLVLTGVIFALDKPAEILYHFPLPDSRYVSRHTTILLRFQKSIDVQDHHLVGLFSIRGTQNGGYKKSVFFSDDRETIICQPDDPFVPGEVVTVTITSPLLAAGTFEYEFTVSFMDRAVQRAVYEDFQSKEYHETPADVKTVGRIKTINGVTVPGDFPDVSVLVQKQGSAPGRLFLGVRQSYFMILENDGTPYFYRKSNDFLMDFKVVANGLLSRTVDNWETGEKFYVTMDHHFEYVDTFRIKHGYIADHHDFQLLPNGHFLIMGNDTQIFDMGKIVQDGRQDARVLGHNFQELDTNHNVVFEWRGWDYLPITDSYEDIQAESFDYAHMNSISLDYDGHYLISCRNLSQCLKINRETGDIIWILGGKRSSFKFTGQDDGNSYQHMFRAVPDKFGFYTLFDNGNDHSPPYSRAVEYKLDTEKNTAEKVWDFRHPNRYYTAWLGSVQRLNDGNTLINWIGQGRPFATEVTPNGETVYEARCFDCDAVYRTFRFDWSGTALRPYLILNPGPDKLTLIFNKFGDENVNYYRIFTGLDPQNMTVSDTTRFTFYDVEDLQNNQRHYFAVTAVDINGTESLPSNVENVYINRRIPGENIVRNGDFSVNLQSWSVVLSGSAQARVEVVDGVFYCDIENSGANFYDIQLLQHNIPVYKNEKYIFEFDAWAESPRAIEAKVAKQDDPNSNYGQIGPTQLTTRRKTFQYGFTMREQTDSEAGIVINCGRDAGDVYIDNVSLKIDAPDRIEQETNDPPEKFTLAQNYPNPFNPQTSIGFFIAKSGRVSLAVYDISGRLAATLIDDHLAAGWQDVMFDAGRFASGVYFYRLQAGETVRVKKMCLLR
ncbi:aryl-sulfate sulfotransferase [candidate division KSB1 bacterium]|nr:aryl-sulfate sulfotransferase [candidate division KSB1 bacterium]